MPSPIKTSLIQPSLIDGPLIGWAFSEFCATSFYTDVKVEKLYYLQGLRVRGQEGVQRDGRRQQGDYLHEEEVFPILSEPHYLILVRPEPLTSEEELHSADHNPVHHHHIDSDN